MDTVGRWTILLVITIAYAGYQIYRWHMERTISKWENVLSFLYALFMILLWIVLWY